jgi:nucleoside-triphosphatase THEP1
MQLIPLKPLSQTWLKASVVGSIWASVEIILGSFLHNLKIPLSGMLLSFISVWLLISFLQVWKENGLIWRAGLICALMKSISPSAFIIGPMIGIFTEALLIELFVFILGKNLIGYLAGGAFAVLSTILHKLISLLILYGFNFIKIISDLYLFAVKQIHLEKLDPAYLIILISLIYVMTGIAGAVAGYITGSKYLKLKRDYSSQDEVVLDWQKQLSDLSVSQNYSLIFLLINLLSMAGILFLLNTEYVAWAIVSSVIYISFCVFKYRNSLKRLKKPTFWISFVIITFAAAFLWNGFSRGAFFSLEGLVIGLKMNARAIIIVIGFASLSVELKNPVIKSVLYHGGFSNLYQSLNLAFSALPFFLSNIASARSKSKYLWGKTLYNLLGQAESLLIRFEKEHLLKPQVVIITGDIHQGKTTFAQNVISKLLSDNIRIAGFFSVGENENGVRTGFILTEIGTERRTELCSDKKAENRLKLGRFYFNQEAIALGNEILNPANISDKQLVVIDEIGPLELNGNGWSCSIEKLSGSKTIPQLWVVRKSHVRKISRKWNIGNAWVYDISDSTAAEVEDKLLEIIK